MTKQEIYNLVSMRGPTRVVINQSGEATTVVRAREILGTKGEVPFDVVFVRDDEWMLGALWRFEDVARAMWADKWVGLVKRVVLDEDGNYSWIPEIL